MLVVGFLADIETSHALCVVQVAVLHRYLAGRACSRLGQHRFYRTCGEDEGVLHLRWVP